MRNLSAAKVGAAVRVSQDDQQLIAMTITRKAPHSDNTPLFILCSILASLLDSLIERLQHTRVHSGDDVHRSIQLFFGHARFPRVREATVDSRIAEPHHGDGEADEHLFPLGEAFHRVRIAIESSKIRLLHECRSLPRLDFEYGVSSLEFRTTRDARP